MPKTIHCLSCHEELASFPEAAEHILEGHLVESFPAQ